MPDTRFLNDIPARPVQKGNLGGLPEMQFCLGQGNPALEIVFAEAPARPTTETLRAAWKARSAGRPAPVLLVALYGNRAAAAGLGGDPEHILLDVDRGQLESICRSALAAPDQHTARHFLNQALNDLEVGSTGLRNVGLFATHFLRNGVPKLEGWAAACQQGRAAKPLRQRRLLEGLGLTVDEQSGPALILRAADARVALAIGIIDLRAFPALHCISAHARLFRQFRHFTSPSPSRKYFCANGPALT